MRLVVGGKWSPERESSALKLIAEESAYLVFTDIVDRVYRIGKVLVIRSADITTTVSKLSSRVTSAVAYPDALVDSFTRAIMRDKSVLYVSTSPFPTLGGASLCVETLLKQLALNHGFKTTALSEFTVASEGIQLIHSSPASLIRKAKTIAPNHSLVLTQLTGAPELHDIDTPVLVRIPSFEHFCIDTEKLVSCDFTQCTNCPRGKDLHWAKHLLACSLFVESVVWRMTGKRPFTIYPFMDMNKHTVSSTGDKITFIRGWPQKGAHLVRTLAQLLPDKTFLCVDCAPGIFDNLSNVEVVPPTGDMRTIWKQTRLLLVPSVVAEAFGRVSVEAMHNGIPVIGTPVGGIPEVIGSANCITDKKPEEWVAAIKKYNDPNYYQERSSQVIQTAKEFNLDGRVNEFVQLHTAILHDSQASMTRVFGSHYEPKLSIITSIYGAERFLPSFFDDLASQDFQDFEIVFIDANSPTHDVDILLQRLSEFRRVRYIRTYKREGIYASWNRGVDVAAGKYVAIANADDRHEPSALLKQVQILDTSPTISLVYNDYLRVDERGNVIKPEVAPDFDPVTLAKYCYTGTHVMMRKADLNKAGRFDENMTVAGDYEMWLRMASLGMKFQRIPEFLSFYLDHSNTITRSNFDKCQSETQLVQRRYSQL